MSAIDLVFTREERWQFRRKYGKWPKFPAGQTEIPVIKDPLCPPGKMFIINPAYTFPRIDDEIWRFGTA